MRFSTVLLAALVVASTTAVPLHKAPVPAPKVALAAAKDPANDPTDPPATPAGNAGNSSPQSPGSTPEEKDDDEPNMTPYVRQLVNGMWEGGVPNYEDPTQPFWKREFAAEGEAKAWAYSKTGAADEIKYEMADGADGDEDMLDQFNKESTSTNNSNNEKAEDYDDDKERPIIDDTLDHTKDRSYHTSYDHSLLHGNGNNNDDDGVARGHANYNDEDTKKGHSKYRGRKAGSHEAAGNTLDKDKDANDQNDPDMSNMSPEVRKAMQAAKKARKNAAWTKAASARNQNNGGNDRLSKKQRKKTQGAKDQADKRSQKLTKLGSGKHKMKNAKLNAQRGH